MKKVFVTILAIVHLSTSMGATVHLHYCMGRLVSWGLAGRSGKTCHFCGMQRMAAPEEYVPGVKTCCHEESKQIKNDKDQKTAPDFFQVVKLAPVLADLPTPVWVDPVVPSVVLSHPVPHGPPLVAAVPVFLRNRNFRI